MDKEHQASKKGRSVKGPRKLEGSWSDQSCWLLLLPIADGPICPLGGRYDFASIKDGVGKLRMGTRVLLREQSQPENCIDNVKTTQQTQNRKSKVARCCDGVVCPERERNPGKKLLTNENTINKCIKTLNFSAVCLSTPHPSRSSFFSLQTFIPLFRIQIQHRFDPTTPPPPPLPCPPHTTYDN